MEFLCRGRSGCSEIPTTVANAQSLAAAAAESFAFALFCLSFEGRYEADTTLLQGACVREG